VIREGECAENDRGYTLESCAVLTKRQAPFMWNSPCPDGDTQSGPEEWRKEGFEIGRASNQLAPDHKAV
jgi:hypothetical protein